MIFWISLFLLTLLSALFLLWLLQRQVATSDENENMRLRRNVELYQQRIARLGDELAKQFVNESEYAVEKEELGRQLLRDVEGLKKAPVQAQQRKRWLLLFIPVPAAALFLYLSLGAFADWQITQQLQALSSSKSMAEYQERFDQVHDAIVKRLEKKPDHISYRLILADYALNKQDYKQATMHYGILAELLPEDDEILARYAQAEYLRNNQSMNANVAQYLDRALRANPNNRTALGLQGIYAMESEDYQAAISAWQKLLNTLPKDAPDAAIIRQGISRAQEALGIDAAEKVVSDSDISVQISLADTVSQLDKNLTVFVYARAAQGPAIPLAAQKLRLADLPATITLNDSQAMMPEMKISNHQRIVIGARVSIGGQPTAQAGDWQAESSAIDWQTQKSVTLEIKEQL